MCVYIYALRNKTRNADCYTVVDIPNLNPQPVFRCQSVSAPNDQSEIARSSAQKTALLLVEELEISYHDMGI